MDKTNTVLLSALLAVAIASLVIGLKPEIQQPAPVVNVMGEINEWFSGGSASTVNVSNSNLATATTQVLAANSGRQYARITNRGNTSVTCLLSNTTTTLAVGSGIILYSSSSVNSYYDIGPDNLYKGVVRCISETATNTVSVFEK